MISYFWPKRDQPSAKRFLKKVLKNFHTKPPRVITVDKNAAYPAAFNDLKQGKILPTDCQSRQIKYLNNMIEQDHRFIKRRVKPGLGFHRFRTAWRTLNGYETMNMIRKGQIEGVEKENIIGEVKFIEKLFGIVA